MNRFWLAAAAVISLTLQACAFVPQKATLAPTLNVAASNEGRGVEVGFRVVDERTSKSLGRRGTSFGAAAEITSDQDIAALVKQQVSEGLQKKGFKVAEFGATSGPQLTVELRLLEYTTSTGFFTGGVQVKGAVKAVASRTSEKYEETYRSDKEKRVVVVPTAGSNETQISETLTEVLTQMFDDKKLTEFLTH